MDGRTPVIGKTADVSGSGCSICLPDPVPVDGLGQVAFDLLVEGRTVSVNTRARAMYCIFGGGEFKIGFKFLGLDMPTAAALARYMK